MTFYFVFFQFFVIYGVASRCQQGFFGEPDPSKEIMPENLP
jgi:hypothetical protein